MTRCKSALALVLLAAACSDAAPAPADEVAAELRGLRLWLQQQARSAAANGARNNAAGAAGPATAAAAVLAPLQPVLDALVRGQRDQAERQLALTQELQRWSRLLADTAGAARAEELAAMTAKLGELEQSMRAQDARHREVETLLQGALERTADRLEDFLRRLDGGAPAGDGTAAPAERSSPPGAPPEPTREVPRDAAPRSSGAAPHDASPRGPAEAPHDASPRSPPDPPSQPPPEAAPRSPSDPPRDALLRPGPEPRHDRLPRPPPEAAREQPAPAGSAPRGDDPPLPANDSSPLDAGSRTSDGALQPTMASPPPRTARAPQRWWWIALSGAAAAVAVVFLRRAWRRTPALRRPAALPQPRDPDDLTAPAPTPVPAPAVPGDTADDRSAQEIWAAAALLGEAVGRLRQRATGEPGGGTGATAEPFAELTAVLANAALPPHAGSEPMPRADGEPQPPTAAPRVAAAASAPRGAPHRVPEPETTRAPTDVAASGDAGTTGHATANGPPPTPPPPPSAPARRAPETLVAHIAAPGAEAKVLAALACERVVLRRPAPVVRSLLGALEIRFHVMPGIPPGERGRLLQRLRDAAR